MRFVAPRLAQRGEEICVPLVFEAHTVERILVDGICHHAAGKARKTKLGRLRDHINHERRIARVDPGGARRFCHGAVKHGQTSGKSFHGIIRPGDLPQRNREACCRCACGKVSRVTQKEEAEILLRVEVCPSPGRNFRSNAGWLSVG